MIYTVHLWNSAIVLSKITQIEKCALILTNRGRFAGWYSWMICGLARRTIRYEAFITVGFHCSPATILCELNFSAVHFLAQDFRKHAGNEINENMLNIFHKSYSSVYGNQMTWPYTNSWSVSQFLNWSMHGIVNLQTCDFYITFRANV